MVSEQSPSNSNSHQFIVDQNQFESQHFDPYGTDSVPGNDYPHSVPLTVQSLGERMSRSVQLLHAVPPQLSEESDVCHGGRLMDLLGNSNEAASHQAQRLSLSLGSVSCRQRPINPSFLDPAYLISGEMARETCNSGVDRMMGDFSFAANAYNPSTASQNQSCSALNATEAFSAAIGNSKYLKPAQFLLEEMVSIASKDVESSNQKYVEKLSRSGKNGSFGLASELKAEILISNEVLSEKHATYVNLLKLLALLDEVERRYEEYYQHMEELVSSFEVIAGLGAGKSYTALALQAMSKHFCSLRNALLSQIRATKQKIEKDMPRISSRLAQLSLFDQEGRQSRIPLQQLGIMPNSRQVWRPIRGLPENSVTILRAWLFEHFLHPYPNDSEKLILASQTGLSKNQVSNWFINARVRLWKPMIEEMYKEEICDSSTESDQLTSRERVGDSAEDLY